jgi:hypothetical protein
VDVYRKELPTNMTKGSGPVNAKEDRLRTLKRWLSEELITENEYELEKQKVLAK